jgi:hypothetical protein
MLMRGLADDNVSVAHTLGLSSAPLAAGRPHAVMLLSGVTHMANQQDLLLLELDFFRRWLALQDWSAPARFATRPLTRELGMAQRRHRHNTTAVQP